MKKLLLLSMLAVLFGAYLVYAKTTTTDCSAPAEASLNIKNSTGSDISAIYVAQSKSDTQMWSKNLLKSKAPLKNGAAVLLPLKREGSDQPWTIKTVDTKGRETLHEKLPLSFINDVELQPDGKTKYKEVYFT